MDANGREGKGINRTAVCHRWTQMIFEIFSGGFAAQYLRSSPFIWRLPFFFQLHSCLFVSIRGSSVISSGA
jgi:hypothetical protein